MPTDLRTLRKQLGWTQQRLADALGISRKQLCESERGKVPVKAERIMAVRYLVMAASTAPGEAP